jgi:hypothetical protein
MPTHNPYDSAASENSSDAADEVVQPSKAKRTPEQKAAVQRHLRHQNKQRSGKEKTEGGAFSAITNTGFGIILRIGLRVMRSGAAMISRGGGKNDVYWGYPIGMLIIVVGGLICCVGLAIWAVLALGQAIYRGIKQ